MKTFLLAILMTTLIGCASYSHQIIPATIPANQYSHMECEQLETEINKTVDGLARTSYIVNNNADSDVALTWAGVLFLPIILVALQGNGVDAANYAVYKGTITALSTVAADKNCSGAVKVAMNKEVIIAKKHDEMKTQKMELESSSSKSSGGEDDGIDF
jgi:hypothetical protein